MKMDRYLILMISDIFWWFNTAIITRIISNTTIQLGYPLVICYITMERSTIFHGKIHYKWPFSIAMLVITRLGNPHRSIAPLGSRRQRTSLHSAVHLLQKDVDIGQLVGTV